MRKSAYFRLAYVAVVVRRRIIVHVLIAHEHYPNNKEYNKLQPHRSTCPPHYIDEKQTIKMLIFFTNITIT